MITSHRVAWASAFLLAAALFYAPLAYGSTRPETLPPLFALLGFSMALGVLGWMLARHWPVISPVILLCVGALLLQGWWMTWDPTFRPTDFAGEGLVDTTFENISQLSYHSMLGTSYLLGAFVLLCGLLGDARLRRFLLLSAAFSGVLISVVGIVLKLGGRPLMRYFWTQQDLDWTDFAFYRYHGNAGAFLNLVWPLILVFTRRAYSPTIGYIHKVIWTFSTLACGLALCLNASKASLIIGILILPWPFSTWLMKLSFKFRMALAAGALLTLATGVFISSRMGQDAAFDRMTHVSEVSLSLQGRLDAYQQYLNALPDVGFFGTGPGLFQVAFPYQTSPLGNVRIGLREYAHEDYLQTLIEWGWMGSLWWFILGAGGLFVGLKSYAHRDLFASRTERHLLLAAILGVSATLVLSLIDFPLQVASLRLFFFVLLALCWASPRLLEAPPSEAPYKRRPTGALPSTKSSITTNSREP